MKILSNVTLLLALGAMVFGTSCVSSKKHKDLMAEKDALENRMQKCQTEKEELNATISDMETMQAKLKTEVANANRELESSAKKLMDCEKMTAAKEAQLNAVKNQINEVMKAVSESGLSVKEKDVKLYVSLANEILYKPGSANISKAGKEVIAQLAEVFKNNGDMQIMVEGHTDSSPIRRSRYLHKTNLELSAHRACNVVDELIKNGVGAAQLTAAGRGDVEAKDVTVEGADAGAANRRIEFIITPSVSGFNM